MDLDTFMATKLDKEIIYPTAESTVLERSDPSHSKPHLRTSSSFELPDMLKSPDTVMEENRSLWTLSSVGKLANTSCKTFVFLVTQYVLQDSRFLVTQFLWLPLAWERTDLDPAKMSLLHDVIPKNVFKPTSVHNFEKNMSPRINNAAAGICKCLRSA